MSTDLLNELEVVVGLAKKATPGKWRVEPEGKNEFGQSEFTIEIYNGKCPIVGAGAFYGDPHDADIAAASVNFITSHHAEIAAAVRDAERYRWLRDKAGDEWEVTHEQPNGMSRVLTMFPDDLDETIDAAMSQEGEG